MSVREFEERLWALSRDLGDAGYGERSKLANLVAYAWEEAHTMRRREDKPRPEPPTREEMFADG